MFAQQRFGRTLQLHGPALQDDDALRCPCAIVYAAGRGNYRPAFGMEPPT
ncbi:hypothetical protein MKN04_11580 [Paenibacillus polymyxa]|nr:hypothetical protein [Paenibacillus polymyxa]